jgi:beta-phosphoglucomutase-like phosphatase (HAD superfamily)
MASIEIPQVNGAVFDLDESLLSNMRINRTSGVAENVHTSTQVEAIHHVAGGAHEQLRDLTVAEAHKISQKIDVRTIANVVRQIFRNAGIDQRHDAEELQLEILEHQQELYTKWLKNEAEPVKGALEFITKLADRHDIHQQMALQTSAKFEHAAIFLDRHDLLRLIPYNRMFTLESVNHPKPDPEVNNLAFASLGLPESERQNVHDFDDDPIRGIGSILAANLVAVGVVNEFSVDDFMSQPNPPRYAGDYEQLSMIYDLAV